MITESDNIKKGDIIVCIEPEPHFNLKIGDKFIVSKIEIRHRLQFELTAIYFINHKMSLEDSFEIGSELSKSFSLSIKSRRKEKLQKLNEKIYVKK